jgi:organic hydroperoxide reductase OsmC/OhrA
MSEHRATIRWTRTSEDFDYERFNREHEWEFGPGLNLPASSAPEFLGAADRVDPEQAFVAAVSSCHMLTFLALASKRRFVVDAYEDEAVGELGKDHEGRMVMTRVELRPRVRFAEGAAPDEATVAQLHEKAHKYCFIANSVKTPITVAG